MFKETELELVWVRTLLYLLSTHRSVSGITKLDTFLKTVCFKDRLIPYTGIHIIHRTMFRANMKYMKI
jgi:hypothetical protein